MPVVGSCFKRALFWALFPPRLFSFILPYESVAKIAWTIGPRGDGRGPRDGWISGKKEEYHYNLEHTQKTLRNAKAGDEAYSNHAFRGISR